MVNTSYLQVAFRAKTASKATSSWKGRVPASMAATQSLSKVLKVLMEDKSPTT
jgi:hypothetical protein